MAGEATCCGGFGPENLPYGVDDSGHVVVAFGDTVIDLAGLVRHERDHDEAASPVRGEALPDPDVLSSGSLNAFMALGPESWAATRRFAQGSTRPTARGGAAAPQGGGPASAVRGVRLRRLLLVRGARGEPWAGCCARTRTRSRRPGGTCPSATTAARPRSSPAAGPCPAPPAWWAGRPHRSTDQPGASMSRSSSASWSA